MAHRAAVYHDPAGPDGKPRGIAKALGTLQSKCLRVVTGAYKATPVRNLETESFVPPIDLYLNKRRADFISRMEATGKARIVRETCRALGSHLKRRQRRRPAREADQSQDDISTASTWATTWQAGADSTRDAMLRDWKDRWQRQSASRHRGRALWVREPADINPQFSKKALARHKHLAKHESSMLTQIRTGKIGLNAFLYKCNVPGVTPECACGEAPETARHLLIDCRAASISRAELPAMRTTRDFQDQAGDPKAAAKLAKWMLRLGRLSQYDLAVQLAEEEAEEERDGAVRLEGSG
jgi:hypothetical protein